MNRLCAPQILIFISVDSAEEENEAEEVTGAKKALGCRNQSRGLGRNLEGCGRGAEGDWVSGQCEDSSQGAAGSPLGGAVEECMWREAQ